MAPCIDGVELGVDGAAELVNVGGAEVVADGAELLGMVQPHDRTERRWSCHAVEAVRGIFQCSDARLQQRRRADPAQDFAAGSLGKSTRFAERARHRSLWQDSINHVH